STLFPYTTLFRSHFETIRKRKDGNLIDVSLMVSPVKDASGKIIGASKIARDISGRKHNERQQRALFELVATMNATPTIDEICNAALGAITQCYNADRASILLVDA